LDLGWLELRLVRPSGLLKVAMLTDLELVLQKVWQKANLWDFQLEFELESELGLELEPSLVLELEPSLVLE
jgi:hypothetical protein